MWLWPGMREQGKGAHPMAAPSTALVGDGGERESAGGVGVTPWLELGPSQPLGRRWGRTESGRAGGKDEPPTSGGCFSNTICNSRYFRIVFRKIHPQCSGAESSELI